MHGAQKKISKMIPRETAMALLIEQEVQKRVAKKLLENLVAKVPAESRSFVSNVLEAGKINLQEPDELWVSKETFMRVSGLRRNTITCYCSLGKIKKKGPRGNDKRYLLSPEYQNNLAVGGVVETPKIAPVPFAGHVEHLQTIKQAEAMRVPKLKVNYSSAKRLLEEKDFKGYATDARFINMAWLAVKCFMDETSFSVELDKIIGEHRAKLEARED